MKYRVDRKPLFNELPINYRQLTPDWRVLHGMISIRCFSEETATRVAQALELLDEFEEKTGPGRFGNRMLFAPIDEAEILIRAREACIERARTEAMPYFPIEIEAIRRGDRDNWHAIRTSARALRDLAKPLAEIQPKPKPVDPDLIEARKIVIGTIASTLPVKDVERGVHDQSAEVQVAWEAIRRGRELAAGDILSPEGLKKLGITASQL